MTREETIEVILAACRRHAQMMCASDHPYDLGLAISAAAEIAGETIAELQKAKALKGS